MLTGGGDGRERPNFDEEGDGDGLFRSLVRFVRCSAGAGELGGARRRQGRAARAQGRLGLGLFIGRAARRRVRHGLHVRLSLCHGRCPGWLLGLAGLGRATGSAQKKRKRIS